MKKIALASLIMLFAVPAFSAVVYTKVIGGGVYYDATAAACADVTTDDTAADLEEAAVVAGAGGTLYVCEGTYSGPGIDSAGGLDTTGDLTIIGMGDRNLIIIDGTGIGTDIFNLGAGTVAIKNLTIQGSDATKYGIKTVATTTLEGVHIKNCNRGLYSLNSGTVNASRLEVSGTSGDYMLALAVTPADYVFNYCLFRDSIGRLSFFDASTAVFNNCVFTNIAPSSMGVFYNTSAYDVTVALNNCIFFANMLKSGAGAYQIFTNNAGTWTINNSFLTDNPLYYGRMIHNPGSATVTISNSVTTEPSPRWRVGAGAAKAYFFIDDTPNISHWYDIADSANIAYGMPVNIALTVNGTQSWTGADWSKLAGYLSGSTNGVVNGLAVHGYSNVYLWTSAGDDVAGTVNAVTASKAGSSITVDITRTDVDDSSTWSGTLQLDALTPLDLTSSAYDEMDELVAYLAGQGVTVGTASGQVLYNHADFIPRTAALKSGVYNINTTQTLPFDQHSLFVTEMKDAKATIEAQLDSYIPGFSVESFVWSGGYYGDGAIAYAMGTVGYSQVRGVRGVGLYGTSYTPAEMQLYAAGSLFADTDITTADPGAAAASYFHSLEQVGGAGGIHGHFTSFDVADWTAVFAAAASTPGLEVMTFNGTMDWLRANEDHATSNVSYRCSDKTDACITSSFDYHLRGDSALVNAGSDVGLTSDYDGRMVPSGSAPEIGLCESYWDVSPALLYLMGF